MSSANEPKKKFGKNLNKLHSKPLNSTSTIPNPQQSSVSNSATSNATTQLSTLTRASSSSSTRNGLLLLSTKRSSVVPSGGSTATNLSTTKITAGPNRTSLNNSNVSLVNNAGGGRMLPRPLNTLSLRSELQDGGPTKPKVKMERSTSLQNHWGSAVQGQSAAEESQSQSSVSAEKHLPQLTPGGGRRAPTRNPYKPSASTPALENSSMAQGTVAKKDAETKPRTPATTFTDSPPDGNSKPSSIKTDQVQYMSRLARERAEARRIEEERRQVEQKRRALQRLKELEDKMAPLVPANTPAVTNISRDGRREEKTLVVLEPLGGRRTKRGVPNKVVPQGANNNTNLEPKLFDPRRTYSSLVGGSGINRSTSLPIPLSTENERDIPSEDCPPPIAVISLSPPPGAYNGGFDRGDGRGGGGKRMLFDPKSGSMVEAAGRRPPVKTSRVEENPRSNRKAKGRGDRGPVRTISKQRSFEDGRGRRREPPRGRRSIQDKEPLNNNTHHAFVKLNERTTPASTTLSPLVNQRASRNKVINESVTPQPSSIRSEPFRVPRTRGVLYQRDPSDGNYVCADGCDADQGFGAHSVPGGRTLNPHAHLRFLEHQASGSPKAEPEVHKPGIQTFTLGANAPLYEQYPRQAHGTPLTQRSDLPYFRPANVSANPTVEALAPTHYLPQTETIKAEDVLHIISDALESPTLQATAHAWAPTQAALAAAATKTEDHFPDANMLLDDMPRRSSEVEETIRVEDDDLNFEELLDEELYLEDDESDSDTHSFLGLGFDPTQNMDTVMMSPALNHSDVDDDIINVGLPALSLGNPATTSTTPHKPFSPLGTPSRFLVNNSTWSGPVTLGGSGGTSITTIPNESLGISMGLGWNIFGSGGSTLVNKSKIEGVNSGNSDGITKSQSIPSLSAETSFLSLASQTVNDSSSTWGTGAFGGALNGLVGTPLVSTALPANTDSTGSCRQGGVN